MSDIDKTINGARYIHVYDPAHSEVDIVVHRLPRRAREKCHHRWLPVSWLFQGHGGWKRGCAICGKLGR
jgi:hypothetical protein